MMRLLSRNIIIEKVKTFRKRYIKNNKIEKKKGRGSPLGEGPWGPIVMFTGSTPGGGELFILSPTRI